jgi:1,4-dihydroxy-2-naphthoyl-CoA synthase
MRYEQILYAVEDSILTITLARPERLNAFTARMCRELLDAFDRSDADDSVRVVIVTGAGREVQYQAERDAGILPVVGAAGIQMTAAGHRLPQEMPRSLCR